MKILYLECDMGISGDMLMSALWGLIDKKEEILQKINSIGFPHTQIAFCKDNQLGIEGYSSKVLIDGEEEGSSNHHHSRKLCDVEKIIENLNVDNCIKDDVKDTYKILANAESTVHGEPVELIHFHEVGAMDAIADLTVCSLLLREIGADVIMSSAVNVGNGTVNCAHGLLPVPAPATALLLKGIPFYKSDIQSELCTPTGATLLKKYADSFGNIPKMVTSKVSYGFGKKRFENKCNCIRAYLGELYINDSVCELACNVDDMTAEEISFAVNSLCEMGALDVSAQSVVMKKGRIGYIIRVLCDISQRSKFIDLIYKYTSTIGIREYICNRSVLDRKIKSVDTKFGKVRVKYSKGFEVEKAKIEYEDVVRIAKQNGWSYSETKKILENFV